MKGRVEGKVALVTGAARGLGAAYASILAEEAASVILTDILDDPGEALAGALRNRGLTAVYQPLDVRREDDWARVVEFATRNFEGLHVLVNNAGIAHMESIFEESLDGWNEVVAVNQTGVFLGMKHCIPIMRRIGIGSVINIASTAALAGVGGKLGAYSAAKSALISMTKNVAIMVAPANVRVNTICPGPVLTEMALEEERIHPGWLADVIGITPLGRAADPRELAHAVLFLASDESSYITGIDLLVDGGQLAGHQLAREG